MLTVLHTFHIVPRLALRAELHVIFNAQAERELVLELVAFVEEEHDRDVLQQVRPANRLRTNDSANRNVTQQGNATRLVFGLGVGLWVGGFARSRNGRGMAG